MIGDSLGDVVSGIFDSMGSSSGFENGEDGISAYALVERREDMRCCWLEISLPSPHSSKSSKQMLEFMLAHKVLFNTDNKGRSVGEVIEGIRNVRRALTLLCFSN